MKTSISIAILLLFLHNGFRDQNIKVSLIPSFETNQIRNYSILSSASFDKNGAEQIISTTNKHIRIKVVSINDNFISMEWKYNEIEFIETNTQSNPYSVLMNTLSTGIIVKYLVDKRGVINSITNRDEIQAQVRQGVEDKLSSMINDNSIDLSIASRTRFQFQMMFSTSSQIDKIIINDLFKFHQLYGKEFTDQPSKIVVDHDIIPETYNIRLKSIDQSNQTCLIVSNLIGDSSKEINNSFEYKLSDHWLINFTSKRESFDPLRVTQFYKIQLLP